jgi:drug/metabolite transporter (DMT)-like permease
VSRTSGGRAGSGGFAYLKEWLWWTGMITMITGEIANFSAYAFAPAVLVTPLGALSVIVSAFLSSILLEERLNLHGKIGSFLCLLGSTVIVINAPDEQEVNTMQEIQQRTENPVFLTYAVIAIMVSAVLIYYYAPRYGKSNLLVYIAICSLIGSLSVTFCKGLGVAIKQTFSGDNQVGNWLTWLFVFGVAVCVVTQMNYLNKALDIFNTSMVTPIYYVMFTTFTIIASAIFFKEWQDLHPKQVLGLICGFGTIITGVFLIHAFKDLKFSIYDLPIFTKKTPKQFKEMVDLRMSVLEANDEVDHLDELRKHKKLLGGFGDPISLDTDSDEEAVDEKSKLQPNGNVLRS